MRFIRSYLSRLLFYPLRHNFISFVYYFISMWTNFNLHIIFDSSSSWCTNTTAQLFIFCNISLNMWTIIEYCSNIFHNYCDNIIWHFWIFWTTYCYIYRYLLILIYFFLPSILRFYFDLLYLLRVHPSALFETKIRFRLFEIVKNRSLEEEDHELSKVTSYRYTHNVTIKWTRVPSSLRLLPHIYARRRITRIHTSY